MGRDQSLYKFVDIYAMLTKYCNNDFTNQFCERVTYFGLQNECFYAIYNTAKLYTHLLNNIFVCDIINFIRPEKKEYMKHIIYPKQKEVYFYNEDFIDWVFMPDRKSKLKKVD